MNPKTAAVTVMAVAAESTAGAAVVAKEEVSRLPSEAATGVEPESAPSNLPRPITSFVGRSRAVADVRRALEVSRLVTLLGPGGVGKTRLAVESAAGSFAEFPDGIWFVELAPLNDPDLVVHALANALRVQESPKTPLLATLIGYLAQKQLLIVLDNCEHLLDASATLISALLGACPALTVLATSREPIAVAGEQTFRVPPLGAVSSWCETHDIPPALTQYPRRLPGGPAGLP